MSDKRLGVHDYTDRAVLELAPLILNLTPVGRAAFARDGLAYLNESELELLYGAVAVVEREMIKAGYSRPTPPPNDGEAENDG